MKRTIVILLAMIILIALCGCNASKIKVPERPNEIREDLWSYACATIDKADEYLDGLIDPLEAANRMVNSNDCYSRKLKELDDATLEEKFLPIKLTGLAAMLAAKDLGSATLQDVIDARNSLATSIGYQER